MVEPPYGSTAQVVEQPSYGSLFKVGLACFWKKRRLKGSRRLGCDLDLERLIDWAQIDCKKESSGPIRHLHKGRPSNPVHPIDEVVDLISKHQYIWLRTTCRFFILYGTGGSQRRPAAGHSLNACSSPNLAHACARVYQRTTLPFSISCMSHASIIDRIARADSDVFVALTQIFFRGPYQRRCGLPGTEVPPSRQRSQ